MNLSVEVNRDLCVEVSVFTMPNLWWYRVEIGETNSHFLRSSLRYMPVILEATQVKEISLRLWGLYNRLTKCLVPLRWFCCVEWSWWRQVVEPVTEARYTLFVYYEVTRNSTWWCFDTSTAAAALQQVTTPDSLVVKMGWPTLVHRMFGADLQGGTLLESPCSRTINSRTRDFMNPSYVSPFLKTGASIPMFRSLGRAPNISFRKKIFQIKFYLIHLLRSFLYVCLNLSHSHRQMTGSGCRLFMQYHQD